jgi:hypothetical protein
MRKKTSPKKKITWWGRTQEEDPSLIIHACSLWRTKHLQWGKVPWIWMYSQIYLCQQAELPWAFVLGGVMKHEQFLHISQVFPTPNLMEVGTWKWGNSPTTQSIINHILFLHRVTKGHVTRMIQHLILVPSPSSVRPLVN